MLKPLKSDRKHNRLATWFNNMFDRTTRMYLHRVRKAVHHSPRWMVVFVAVIGLCALMFVTLPSSFLPEEDQGNVMVMVQLPPGATKQRTSDVMTRLNKIMHENDAVDGVVAIGGFSFVGGGEGVGMAFVSLKPWGEREQSATDVIQWANRHLHRIKGAQIFAVNLPVIQGLGQFGGFDFRLQDAAGVGHEALADAADQLVAAARKEPSLANVRINGLQPAPQLQLDVNRLKARSMGVSVTEIFQTIQLMLAPVYANDFNYNGRVQQVLLQADAAFRMSPEAFQHMYVHSSNGAMVPVASVVDTTWTTGPPDLTRYNGLAALQITGAAAPGFSSGQAMDNLAQLVDEQLPDGFGYAWSGQSLQEKMSGAQAPIIYALSLIVVFLCLAALYESWTIPLSVLMVVPLGVLGTLLFTFARGLNNDIYFKVGLIAVIGLAAKNAILIIEFARDEQLKGNGAIASIMEACRLRFRPVLMTSLAFIAGVMPLALSSGAGANSRHAIGTGVIGGMFGATTLGLLLIPVFYVVVRRMVGDKSDGTENLPADHYADRATEAYESDESKG